MSSLPSAEAYAPHLVRLCGANPETAETLAELILGQCEHDGSRMVVKGRPKTGVDLLIDEIRASEPVWFKADYARPDDAPKADPETVLPVGFQPYRTLEEKRDELVKDLGNPWRRGTWSVTGQALVEGHDPARAARLRREAGQ